MKMRMMKMKMIMKAGNLSTLLPQLAISHNTQSIFKYFVFQNILSTAIWYLVFCLFGINYS